VGRIHRLQRGQHAGVHLGRRQALVDRPEGHVVLHRGHEELVVGILEHVADPAPHFGQAGTRQRDAFDRHAALARQQQAIDMLQQRRLARAIGTDDGHRLTRQDAQVDAAQRQRAVRIVVCHCTQLDGRRDQTGAPVISRPRACGRSIARTSAK
jgi:hypothetical protein